MTNFERWQLLMKDITSPQSFIDFGWYYTVAAALQRRVWCGPEHKPIFPNIYVILVAPPGVGKGLVIKEVEYLLRYHYLEDPNAPAKAAPDANVTTVDPHVIAAINAANYAQATNGEMKRTMKKPLLIPLAANATTFEALVRSMTKATRRINYMKHDEKLGKNVLQIYTHCSLAFCLEEISSLFRRHTEDVANFLLQAYDCGNYEYDTKTQGNDEIHRCCLNFFGGTTPVFMESTFNDKLLNDGFSSRTWFIVEQRNRFDKLLIPPLSPEQTEARAHLVEHIKRLSKLYGHIEYETDAWQWLERWWEQPDRPRANKSPKLDAYYGRKNIHAQKLAQVLHFSEDADMNEQGAPKRKLSLATVQKAVRILDEREESMHLALNFEGNNPLATVGKKMMTYVRRNGPQSTMDFLMEFWGDADKDQIDQILHHFVDMKKLKFNTTTNKWELYS